LDRPVNRDELLDAVKRLDPLLVWTPLTIIDAVEPLIRADEREHINNLMYAIAEQKTLDDLRAKVEALPRWRMDDTLVAVLAYEDVLALLDGADR
jgi:hypothetical protein